MTRSGRSQNRRGMTLVELTVLLTAVAVMLGVCVMTLALTIRLESDGRAAFERAEALNRLAERFRADVHQARSATLEEDRLRLDMGTDRAIEYRLVGASPIRLLFQAGAESGREAYRIPRISEVEMAIRREEDRTFAVIVVQAQDRPDRIDPVRAVEIPALVGKLLPLPASPSEGGRS